MGRVQFMLNVLWERIFIYLCIYLLKRKISICFYKKSYEWNICIYFLNLVIFLGSEYPDSGVGSEPEGRCDERNEENDNDSDPESPSPPSHSSYLSSEDKFNGDYSVSACSKIEINSRTLKFTLEHLLPRFAQIFQNSVKIYLLNNLSVLTNSLCFTLFDIYQRILKKCTWTI